MKIEETKLAGLFVITPKISEDSRGFFMEVFRQDQFRQAGVTTKFVQENHSFSKKNVLRGLHLQWNPPLGKLIRVINGSAFMVATDLRKKSKTLGQWFGLELSSDNKKEIFAPQGFASGFCVFGEVAEVEYHYTAFFNPLGESSIIWNDKQLGIDWPINNPIVSLRDQRAITLREWLASPQSDQV